uniref:Putative secreted protein n=1 Tax=Ixodes ricinus TaxID=34613 RepID=V5IBP8_IXORI
MIPFSMVVMWFTRRNLTWGFGIGTPCITGITADSNTVCGYHHNYAGNATMGPAYTRLGSSLRYAMTYDGPDEIKWKMCSATRKFPNITLGMALFNLESEDSKKICERKEYTNFKYAAGYWRVSQVTDYFRKIMKNSNFTQLGPACQTT